MARRLLSQQTIGNFSRAQVSFKCAYAQKLLPSQKSSPQPLYFLSFVHARFFYFIIIIFFLIASHIKVMT